jgi:pimeloyl-ACP methyl ester carboxylesterase
VFERVQALLQAGVLMTMVLILSLLRPVIMMGLRSAVRSKRFWQSGLQQAVFDKSKVDEEMVNAYRLPQLVRGWEDGMLQFLVARLSGVPSAASGGASGLEDTKLAERLAEVVNKHRIPVLIVHGQADKMVPVENSFRLAKSMANARVAVLKRSGHCPQEELPEAFAEVVGKFLEAVVARNTSNSSSRSSGSGGASSSSQAS